MLNKFHQLLSKILLYKKLQLMKKYMMLN